MKIFIIQHYDPTHCKPYGEDPKGQGLEEKHHGEQAFLLAREIRAFCLRQQHDARDKEQHAAQEAQKILARKKRASWEGIQVKCFLMDLQGEVKHLCEEAGNRTAKGSTSSKQSRA